MFEMLNFQQKCIFLSLKIRKFGTVGNITKKGEGKKVCILKHLTFRFHFTI